MAKNIKEQKKIVKKKTSIGLSTLSRPTSKSGRRSYKAYRGQGHP